MIPLVLGTLLAILALTFVLYPIFFLPDVSRVKRAAAPSPESQASVERDTAVAALREIEFDSATGKLSESDYAQLKQRYTQQAITAMRREGSADVPDGAPEDEVEAAVLAYRARHAECPACGPRPESDALFCSSCGLYLPGECAHCGAAVQEPGARFCIGCGRALAA